MKKTIDYTKLRVGQVILEAGTSFDSKIISWFEEDYITHAGLIIKMNDEWFVSEEKSLRGLGFTKLEDFVTDKYYLIREPKVKYGKKEEEAFNQLALKWTNTGFYNILNTVITQGIRYTSDKLYRIFGFPKHEWIVKFKTKNGCWNCSEWYGFAVNTVLGIMAFYNIVSPADLHFSDLLKDSQQI